jgi:tetratricopeptide (TPR) repeat protein
LDAPDEGVEALEEAVLLAEDSGALDALGTAELLLHLVYLVRGEFDRSRGHAERGAAIAKKTGDTDLLSMHTANLGLQLYYLGDWREAQGYLERALQLERSTQLSYFSSLPHAYLGMLYRAQGAWEDASRCFSEAVALAREADVKGQLPYAECRLAEMDVLQGRPTEAIARLEPCVSEMRWQYEVVLLSARSSALRVAWRTLRRLLEAALLAESGQRRSITCSRWRRWLGARASNFTKAAAFLSRHPCSAINLEFTETRKPPTTRRAWSVLPPRMTRGAVPLRLGCSP